MNTHSTQELVSGIDPSPARAVALESAARVGVPFEALNVVRAMPSQDLTASQWLRVALDVGDRYEEAA